MLHHFRFFAWLALGAGITGLTMAAHSVAEAPAFAAPEIIIVYGSLLPEQRVIASFKENHRLLLSVGGPAPFPYIALARRPELRLALFWGSAWRATAESPARLRVLRPEQANQQGTFYPATENVPALLSVGASTGVLSDSGLAVLRRHGVPVRIP